MLASRLLADKTSRFTRRIAGGGILAESRPVGRVRKVAMDRLEAMQQCHSSTAARSSTAKLGLHMTNILCVHGLGLICENSENLSHAKVNTPMVYSNVTRKTTANNTVVLIKVVGGAIFKTRGLYLNAHNYCCFD